MTYIDVIWLHELSDEPYRLVSELDADNFETRKLEFFRSGDVGIAASAISIGTTMLGIVALPEIDEINADDEFQCKAITKQEFEELWLKYAV